MADKMLKIELKKSLIGRGAKQHRAPSLKSVSMI